MLHMKSVGLGPLPRAKFYCDMVMIADIKYHFMMADCLVYALELMPFVFHTLLLRPDPKLLKSAARFSWIPDCFGCQNQCFINAF